MVALSTIDGTEKATQSLPLTVFQFMVHRMSLDHRTSDLDALFREL
jgi:hypothetical protein